MFNTLIARESDRADQIKSRSPNTPYANGFAFIVANPPYGASLSDEYKNVLKSDYSDVFFGQPDTYVFFFKLAIELLGIEGKLGFITPNTYLMGNNTEALRKVLLDAGRIEQIVDLPQGIWSDVNVDCVLLFLIQETNEKQRKKQQPQINFLGLRDTLDKLTTRNWNETIKQQQSRWLENPRNEIDIRYDSLMQEIEDACLIQVKGNGARQKVLRLGDVTESNQGIIVYKTKAESQANLYIRKRRNVPSSEPDWHPLLDSTSFVGRYQLRWGEKQPYLKYGDWLCRSRERKFFDSPKIILVRLRNKALKRRLVATFDDTGFYNRDNFNNIIQENTSYALKYLLALFNSSVLNHWYRNRFDNVNINPKTFRQLPIYPADADTQTELVEKVDRILAKNQEINQFREQGYVIRKQRNGNIQIEIPYDRLLTEIQQNNPNFSTLTLFDAKAVGLFAIPNSCDLRVTISSNIYIPTRYPTSVVLRHSKLWLVANNDKIRRYLLGYLKLPQWQGKTWDEIKDRATLPAEIKDLDTFFAAEEKRRTEIQTLFDEVVQIDAEIDDKVLDLYGIIDPIDRQRILAAISAEDEETNTTQLDESSEEE